jgi:hypothetical protein
MKTSILLLLQSVLLFAVLAILIDGLIRLPDIETINNVIRAIWTGIVSINFSHALYLYLSEK